MKRGLILASLILAALPLVFAQSGARGRSRVANFELTVVTNVDGAAVSVDDETLSGGRTRSVQLAQGDYTVRVTAPGYRPFQQTVTLAGPLTVTATLEPETYVLTVRSNVPGQVFINNAQVGSTLLREALRPGTYQVRVSAPNHIDFSTTVQLSQDQVINAELQPANATATVRIPRESVDQTLPGAEGMITVFIDGRPMVGERFEIPPGRRTVRVRSGGLVYEFTQVFEPGQRYTIVPALTVQVR